MPDFPQRELPALYATDYGVVADGSNDDGAALLAAIVASIDATSHLAKYEVILPPGELKITAPIVIPLSYGLRIRGQGRYITTISQATDGQMIFSFTTDLTHSTSISKMSLQYGTNASPIDSSNTGSIAFSYHVTGGASGGFFYHTYDDLHIRGAYRGFVLFETDGNQTLWGTLWNNILFEHIKNRCVSLLSAGGIGIPNCIFQNVRISNTGTPTIVNTSEAFRLTAVNEAVFLGGNFEGWNDTLVYAESGTYVTMTGVHIENHLFATAVSKLFIISNATVQLNTTTVSGAATAGNTTFLILFQIEAGGRIWCRGGWHHVDTSLGSAGLPEVLWGDGTDGLVLGAKFEAFLNYAGTSGLNDPGQYDGHGLDRSISTGAFFQGGVRTLPYSATIATDLDLPSRYFKIVATNTTAFTVSNPTNATIGDVFTYHIANSSGGKQGVVTWGANFNLVAGPFVNAPTGSYQTITFEWDGVKFSEISRSGVAGGFQPNTLQPAVDLSIGANASVVLPRRMLIPSGVNVLLGSGAILRML